MAAIIMIINDWPALLVRTAQTSSGLYTIRCARGFLIQPASASAIHSRKAADRGR